MIGSDPPASAQERTRVISLPAEVDFTNAAEIGSQLSSALAAGVAAVIADMSGTTFCDSSGISMLVRAHQRARANGAELRLVARSTAVLRALTLVRIDYLMPVYPSLKAALAASGAPRA
jgi:anti-sigma B factor antagonist